MKAKIIIEYYLSKKDYPVIKEALKANYQTVKKFYEFNGITRVEFYKQISGEKPTCKNLLHFIRINKLKVAFEGLDEDGE